MLRSALSVAAVCIGATAINATIVFVLGGWLGWFWLLNTIQPFVLWFIFWGWAAFTLEKNENAILLPGAIAMFAIGFALFYVFKFSYAPRFDNPIAILVEQNIRFPIWYLNISYGQNLNTDGLVGFFLDVDSLEGLISALFGVIPFLFYWMLSLFVTMSDPLVMVVLFVQYTMFFCLGLLFTSARLRPERPGTQSIERVKSPTEKGLSDFRGL